MRARILIVVIAMLVSGACGTTEPTGKKSAATVKKTATTDGNDTSTTSESDGPSTTEEGPATTSESDGPPASDIDLTEALPEEADLPDGFSETEPDEDGDDDGTTYEASPDCEALIESLEGTEITAGGEKKAFANEESVEVTTTIKAATEQEMSGFGQLSEFLGDCDSFTAKTDDGSTAEVTVAAEELDLGDDGFVADMDFVFSGGGIDLEFGITMAAVVRDDILFSVELVDGIGDTFEVTPRDRELAIDLAGTVDDKLSELLSD